MVKTEADSFIKYFQLPRKPFVQLAREKDWKTFLDQTRKYRPRPLYFVVDEFPKIKWVKITDQPAKMGYPSETLEFVNMKMFFIQIKQLIGRDWESIKKQLDRAAANTEAEEAAIKAKIEKR